MAALSRRRLLAVGLAGAATATVTGVGATWAQGSISGARARQIQQLATRFLQDFDAPGLTFAIGQRGKVIHEGAFGSADGSVPMRPAHRMRLASLSKPITAAAIMALRDEGRIRIEDRIFGQNGFLALDATGSATLARSDWLHEISVGHLLTHTAGGWTNDQRDPMFLWPELNQNDLIRSTLLTFPLINRPGTTYAYSNFGYCLLGQVIAKITGQSYADFVTRRILTPAGATGMEIGGDGRAARRPMEVAYQVTQGDGDPYAIPVARMDAHGGWIGTAADYARFLLHVDGHKSAPDVISAASVALMAQSTPASRGYGHGWTVNPNHRNRWHTGSLPGTACIGVLVQGGSCFVGLVNARRRQPDIIEALDRLMWEIHSRVAA